MAGGASGGGVSKSMPETPPSRHSTAQKSSNARQDSPTSVEEELLSSVEKIGEMLLSACTGGAVDAFVTPAAAGGTGTCRTPASNTSSLRGTTSSRGRGDDGAGTSNSSTSSSMDVVGCCGVTVGVGVGAAGVDDDRPASPTTSVSSRSSSPSYLNTYSTDLFASSGRRRAAAATATSSSSGGHYQHHRASSSSQQVGTTTSAAASSTNTASLVHSRAFPPMQNSVTSAERFANGTASDVLSLYFADSAPRSMEKFHIERGDDSVRFGRWTELPTATYRLDRAQSSVDALTMNSMQQQRRQQRRRLHDLGRDGVGTAGRATPPPLSSSLLGAAGGVGGSRRPTLRGLPPGGGGVSSSSTSSSAAAAAERQSLSLLGDVPPFLLSRPTLERHGAFRTPVRVPGAGMSVTEVSIVQRLFHMGGKKKQKHRRRGSSSSSSSSSGHDDTTYIIESVLRLLDVPYSDRFRVAMRQTITTEQRAVKSETPTIDECLACSIPLCTPHLGGASRYHDGGSSSSSSSVGSSSQRGSSSLEKMMSTAILRLEFEIQFHRTCLYEDRIRKMLTKKINKLMLSWCLWAQDGWLEERAVSSPNSRMCMGVPLSSVPAADCSAIPGCGDNADNSSVASASSSSRSQRAKKWQSLSKRNDSFLLWSMTDIDEQEDDIVIGDESSLASDMSNVGLHRLEWRNRSLTGKEQVETSVSSLTNFNAQPFQEDYSDKNSYRGQGIELCLSDDEEYTPNRSPRTRRHNVSLATIPGSQRSLSPHGVEVVYVSDGSTNSDTDSPPNKSGGAKKVVHADDTAKMSIPDLQNAPPMPTSVLKGRSREGFNRRKNMFGQRKRLKALSEHSEADTSSDSVHPSI